MVHFAAGFDCCQAKKLLFMATFSCRLAKNFCLTGVEK
jgi:hypothetical protein